MALPMAVRIHGVNQIGHEGSNDLMCQDRDLPWLQEVPEELVWSRWAVTYRDVIILDEKNVPVAVYNLTENNLAETANYEALKAILVEIAGGQ